MGITGGNAEPDPKKDLVYRLFFRYALFLPCRFLAAGFNNGAAVAKNEKFAPINGNATDAENLYNLFVGMTDGWIQAPGIPSSDIYLVAKSADDYKDVFHPAFTQEFEDWAVRMREWAEKGYWPKDILSSQKGGKDNFNNGLSGAFITHQSDWTGNYGALKQSIPDVTTSFWCPAEANGKIERTPGIQNATAISKNCPG